MKTRRILLLVFLMMIFAACSNDTEQADNEVDKSSLIPALSEYSDKEIEEIDRGQELVTHTNDMLPENVGNNLSCASCHAGAGRGDSLNLIGVTEKFPQYSEREGEDVTLEDRINGCFLRSMDGEEIDPEGETMEAFISYFEYLSENIESEDQYDFMTVDERADNIPAPNVEQGANEFSRYNCLSCHGRAGTESAYTGPDLWGPGSFNDGAGMARFSNMQYFIKHYMPKGREGTLSEQEASNIAAYILMQDRPEFEGVNRFPNGNKPDDYLNEETKEALRNNYLDWTDFERVQDE